MLNFHFEVLRSLTSCSIHSRNTFRNKTVLPSSGSQYLSSRKVKYYVPPKLQQTSPTPRQLQTHIIKN